MHQIPLVDTGRLFDDEREAIEREIARVHKNGLYVKGPAVFEFEEEFAAYHGEGFTCVGVGNGEDALTLSIKSLDAEPGGQILVPSNDGGFAALACQNAGFKPVPVDVDETSALVTVEDLTRALTRNTVAVVATHLHGSMVDIGAFSRFCDDNSLLLIEDCSQAHGATSKGIRVGTTGLVAAYSHYPTKNLGAFGDAGSVVTRNTAQARKIRHLANYGWEERYSIAIRGGQNTRLDSIQAGVLKAKLPFLDRNNEIRAQILQRYAAGVPSGRFLHSISGTSVAHHAVLVTSLRAQVSKALTTHQIGWDIHYPHLIQDMPGLEINRGTETPVSKALSKKQLSLPCFPSLQIEEVDFVTSVIIEAMSTK